MYEKNNINSPHVPAIECEGPHYALRYPKSEIEMRPRIFLPDNENYPAKSSSIWMAPFDRNDHFTGRESELKKLHDMLSTESASAKAAVSGLGGMGKTQLVLEFLYRLKEMHENCSAIWIHATTMESLNQGYHAVARQLGIPEKGKDLDIKKVVQEYLSNDSDAGKWVLVVDNADDIDMWVGTDQSTRLIDYLPKSKNGKVIFTTRDRKIGVRLAQQNTIELSKVAEDTATQMLRNLLIHKDLVSSKPADTKAILEWLTYLPLGIVQAAAYINENGITLSDYLMLVDREEQDVIDLLTEEFEDVARYRDTKNPVATTWLISFRQIQERDPLAAEYMSLMACCDHKDIPQLILPPGPSRKKEIDSIGTLHAYSFIARRSGDLTLDMHRLVHLTVRNWLRIQNSLAEWTAKAILRLAKVFPDPEHKNRGIWRVYLPHAHAVLSSDLVSKNNPNRTDLAWKIALSYYSDGRFDEAEILFQEVMAFRTNALGEEHPETLKSVAKLALNCHAQSRFQQSKELGEKAMHAQKRILGREDPETLSTMSHLAMTYSDLSQWKKAEELELQAMKYRTRILGKENPDTLVSMSNLVYLYNCQGWWAQAEELGKQVITARKKMLGVEHPDTLLSIGNLAFTYNNEGKYKDAEELLAYVVDIRTRVLGQDHPHTLSGMSNLAVSYHHQDRLDEAEALQKKVVETRQAILGPEHFSTLTSMAHLSSTYHKQNRLTEAETLGLQVMELRKKVLGPEHHHTLTSKKHLALIYFDAGKFAKAEELQLQVLADRIQNLGMGHPHSIASMESLAATYKNEGRPEEAENIRLQVAETSRRTDANNSLPSEFLCFTSSRTVDDLTFDLQR